jgi:hypothetical protein
MEPLPSVLLGVIAGAEDLASHKAVRALVGANDKNLDRETGLTILSEGCVADQGMFAYADGYNRIVNLFIQLRGIPSNSRKPWDEILFRLNAYFDEREKTETPLKLIVDGKPVFTFDGKTRISLASIKRTDAMAWAYELRWGQQEYLLLTIWPHADGTIQCFPGPPESDFVLLRGGDASRFLYPGIDRYTVTIALDLRFGLVLEEEAKINN